MAFEGVVTKFVYDNFGQLASKLFYENQTAYLAGTPADTWTYEYDALGRMAKTTQQRTGEVARDTITTYNAEGHIASITSPEGTIFYEYDKFGRQTKVSLDSGETTCYTYDRFGRLASVSDSDPSSLTAKTTRYEYDACGNLAKTIMPNGVIMTYQYDNMNRLTKLTNWIDKNNNDLFDENEGEGVSQFNYDLDELGRKTTATEHFWTEFGKQSNHIAWEYDVMGRLTSEAFDHYDDEFDQTSEWIYDLVGNRLQQTVDKWNGGTTKTTYTYDANDRLLAEISGDKTTLYGYDHTQQTGKTVAENGILVSETTFEYDAQGRMAVVTITTGNRVEKTVYGYGADGMRVSSEHEAWEDNELVSKTRTEYLNDPLNITGYSQVLKTTEFDSEGNVEKTTTYVIGHQRISQIVTDKDSNQQEYYFTFDGHGSMRVSTDFSGVVVQLYSFDAYGNALGFNPSEALTEFLYSGKQFDAKIGQQYLRARYYDPATGRFNRLDPFFGNHTDPQSFHNYLYCHADPIQGIDPSGKFFCTVSVIVTCAISSGARAAYDGKSIGFLAGFTANLAVASNAFALAGGLLIDGMALIK